MGFDHYFYDPVGRRYLDLTKQYGIDRAVRELTQPLTVDVLAGLQVEERYTMAAHLRWQREACEGRALGYCAEYADPAPWYSPEYRLLPEWAHDYPEDWAVDELPEDRSAGE